MQSGLNCAGLTLIRTRGRQKCRPFLTKTLLKALQNKGFSAFSVAADARLRILPAMTNRIVSYQ
jgi:hypothetical protein